MAALASVFVEVKPTTDRFEGDLRKKLARVDGSRAGISIGQSLGHGMRIGVFKSIPGIAKGLVGAFAAVKAVQVFGGFIADAQESARVSRITENVIRSTGGAAKVTAGQVGALATAISNKTGADDETVQSGQNMLLTFTNIRNEVGKGNDIFNQASTSVVDLAAAMNNGQVTTDGVKTASIQLGKALNDPIKGVTALRKVGVSFTTQQTDQIKKLVESGHTLDAQKIILRELGKEFGGTAAAAADPMTKLRTILGNLGESIGTLVLPIVGKFANLLGNTVVPAIYKIGDAFKLVLGDDGAQGFAEVMDNAFGNTGKSVGFFRTVGEGIRQLVFGIQGMIAAFKDGDVTSDGFVGQMERVGAAARGAFDYFKAEVLPRLKEFGGFLAGTVLPQVGHFADFLIRNRDALIPLAAAIGSIIAAVRIWIAVVKAYTAVQVILNLAVAANPIGALILLIVGLVAAFVTAYKTSDTFRHIVQAAFGAVQTAISAVFNWVKNNWPLLLGILTGPIGAAVILVIKNWDKIKAGASAVIGWVRNNWPLLLGILTGPIGAAAGLIIKSWDKIKAGVAALWTAIKSAFRDGVRIAVGTFLGLVQNVLDGVAKAFGWVPKIGGKLRDAAADFRKFRDQVNTALGGVKSRNVKVSATLQGLSASRAASEFATGGPVFGPGTATSDSIPAMLSSGEHVLTAREVKAFGGHDAVMAMRQEAVRGFAAGGPVGFDISTQLNGMAKFKAAIDAFNKRVDAMATKLAIASGGFSANLAGVVNFAKAQAGKPYIWGAAGPGGYDCSGFVSNLVEVAKGLPLYRRLFATGSMRSYPWSNHFKGAFEVGWFTGNPGHTGATVNGVNMESRGGDGVVVGSRSRGANYTFFNQHALLARGGPVPNIPGRIGGDAFRVNHFLNRMDPARRDLYRRLYGLPTAPHGWRWDRLEALVANVVPGGLGRIGGDAFRVNHFLSRMDDGRRDLYRRLYGLPGAPQGWAWAEDESLVRRSFFRRPAASHAGMIQAEDGSWVPRSFYGFAAGGPVLPGDPPFDILDPRGRHFQRGLMEQLQQATQVLDDGGWWKPGFGFNGTGQPERVRTAGQEDAIAKEIRALRRDLRDLPIAQVDDRYVRRAVRNMNTRDPNGW